MKGFNQRRRRVLQSAGVAAMLNAVGMKSAFASAKEVRIGFVSPQTGSLAAFGEADKWVIAGLQSKFQAGIQVGGKVLPVKVIVKDSQSSPNRAGEVASDLILKDNVDLILVSSTPETANPVSDACELNEVPCISTVAPWQPWFFGRGGNPIKDSSGHTICSGGLKMLSPTLPMAGRAFRQTTR
ncbi:ABC transporter substrate-binding protein [Pseudoduganella sp. UC29_106]|uniref:ABC transporter substrate-binding protein n=1 Tax=Pseudoduganella sp. UC29_106 TaxID=3374553 RepID=UPI0037563836